MHYPLQRTCRWPCWSILTLGLVLPCCEHRSEANSSGEGSPSPSAYPSQDAPRKGVGATLQTAPPSSTSADNPSQRFTDVGVETLGELVERLSESDGAFFSENLVSNESSYLQAAHWLAERRGSAGAYIGVGPEQNLSYIAILRPQLAFIVDIRRDNLLLHLLYKTAFERATTRAEWLAHLLSRELKDGTAPTEAAADVVTVLDRVDAALPRPDQGRSLAEETLRSMRERWHMVPHSDDEQRLIALAQSFAQTGLNTRFESTSPRPDFPTLRRLLEGRDPTDQHGSFLMTVEGYQFVRDLYNQDKVVAVTGDLAGNHTLAGIARVLRQRNLNLSVLYTSNVEQYLLMNDKWSQWRSNVASLPSNEQTLLVRSYSDRKAPHPAQEEGSWITLAEPVQQFLTRRDPKSYRELALRSFSRRRNDSALE